MSFLIFSIILMPLSHFLTNAKFILENDMKGTSDLISFLYAEEYLI